MRFAPALLICALALAACGAPVSRATKSQTPVVATVTPPNFSDAAPHEWQGRKPTQYSVHGIDVARFQSELEWEQARANGVNFVFIKATEGSDRVDAMFQNHWRGAGRAGVKRGAYHFFYLCGTAQQQARWYIKNVPRTRGALPPVLDMEWTPYSPTCTLRPPAEWIREQATIFLDVIEAHYGQRPIIYSSLDFYDRNEMWRIPRSEFWLRTVAGHPTEKFPGQDWTFWQYTSTGLVPGASGKIDINVFRGSPTAWASWLAQRSQ